MQPKGKQLIGVDIRGLTSLISQFPSQILELHKRLESAKSQIKQLPGIDYNKKEQLRQLELLRSQLAVKQKLIQKYKKQSSDSNNGSAIPFPKAGEQ